MRKERKVPSIVKPLIDEKTALAFASTSSAPDRSGVPHPERSAGSGQFDNAIGKNMVRISLVIKKSLYERIAKDAARKDRTVDDHLKKHLAKHYGK